MSEQDQERPEDTFYNWRKATGFLDKDAAEKKRSEMCPHMLQVIELCKKLKIYFSEEGIDSVVLDCKECNKRVSEPDKAFHDDTSFMYEPLRREHFTRHHSKNYPSTIKVR